MNLPVKKPSSAVGLLLGLTMLLGACASSAPPGRPHELPPVPDTMAKAGDAIKAEDSTQQEDVDSLLRFHQNLRQMSPSQLSAVASTVQGLPQGPARSLRLAMVLSQTRQSGDLMQAQAHLDRVLAASQPQAQAIKPLAELLSAHLAEQRRLAEAQDKQAQHIKEQQRKIEQLTSKLDALKTIEQTLPAPASSLAPGNAPAAALEGGAKAVGS